MNGTRRIAILSDDAVFARMLSLELSFRSYALADENHAELLIIDADAYGEYKTHLPCVYFGRREHALASFLHRPFDMKELFELIELAFSGDENREPKIIGNGRISVAGEAISLSDAEMSLFELLLDERGKPISRERIAAEIFPDAKDGSKVADVYVCYLRKKIDEKLGRQYIKTVRGNGYMIK